MVTPLAGKTVKIGQQKKKLFVDILNYGGYFFTQGGCHWEVESALSKVEEFVKASKNSGYEMEVFIDAGIETEEAILKWRTRREMEVSKGERNMPQAMNVLLGEMFALQGIKVHYSTVDNDDTIVAFAVCYDGDIVSRDSDFMFYDKMPYRLYDQFLIKNGKLILTERTSGYREKEIRTVIEPPPPTMDKFPGLVRVFTHQEYLRGTPSPLVKLHGNPHMKIVPLRQALYARLDIN